MHYDDTFIQKINVVLRYPTYGGSIKKKDVIKLENIATYSEDRVCVAVTVSHIRCIVQISNTYLMSLKVLSYAATYQIALHEYRNMFELG